MNARRINVGIALLFIGAVAVCWIIPWRLATGPGGSLYTFGYVPEEYNYAQRMQPLVDGATATNPFNGICDPKAHSQFFLEDACRAVMTAFGLDVVSVVWVWRLLMPLTLAVLLVLLSHACLPRRRHPWGWELRLAAGAAALPLLYCLYEVFTQEQLALYGYLNRIPTNIEYPLSVFLAWAFVRFVAAPRVRWGLLVMLGAVTLVYLRFYAAIPWALALGSGLVFMLATGRLRPAVWLPMLGLLIAGLTPWALVMLWNRDSPGNVEQFGRYFHAWPYAVHSAWPAHFAVLALCAPAAYALNGRWRPVVVSVAFAMATLPFVCGLMTPIRSETLLGDRYGSYYLIALLALALLVIGEFSQSWRGRGGLQRARQVSAGLLLTGAAACGGLAWANVAYDFYKFHDGLYGAIVEDQRYLDGYTWVRGNTPPDALFIVDDGFDWSRAPRDPVGLHRHIQHFHRRDDLFQIVGRRRRVFAELMGVETALRNDELLDLSVIQRGTFGFPVTREAYVRAFKRFAPAYIFWRKYPPVVIRNCPPAPIPRGWATLWLDIRRVVYDDDACQIWEIDVSRLKDLRE